MGVEKFMKTALGGNPTSWLKKLCSTGTILFVLSGCSGVHLYDKSKDETATAIQKKHAEIDIEKVFKTESTNLQTILKHELKVRGDFIDNRRSGVIWSFVMDGDAFESLLSPGKDNYAGKRLKALGVGEGEGPLEKAAVTYHSVDKYFELLGKYPIAKNTLSAMRQNQLKTFRFVNGINWQKPYSCLQAVAKSVDEAIKDSGVKTEFVPFLRSQYKSYQELCKEYVAGINLVKKLGEEVSDGTLLSDAYKELDVALARLKKIEGAIKSTKRALPKKKGEDEKPKVFLANLQEKLIETEKSLESVDEVAGFLGIDKTLTEERVNALSVILRGFGGGALPDFSDEEKKAFKEHPELHRAAIIAAGLPGLAGDLKKLNDLLSDPGGRAGMALQYGYQKLKLNYLNRQVELVKQRAQLAADQLRAHLHETVFLYTANKSVKLSKLAHADARKVALVAAIAKATDGRLSKDEENAVLKAAKLDFESPAKLNYSQLQALPNSKAKRLLMQGLFKLDMSLSVARRNADALSYRLIDNRHQEIVEADAFAARAWKNLLDGPIKQIQIYHKAGIKREEISEIVSNLTRMGLLGFIGVKEANK
jgi:hypothetical protein